MKCRQDHALMQAVAIGNPKVTTTPLRG